MNDWLMIKFSNLYFEILLFYRLQKCKIEKQKLNTKIKIVAKQNSTIENWLSYCFA